MKLTALAATALLWAAAPAAAETVNVEIDTENPIGVINPDIYGQFMEHLGRGIYEGIWVGEDSDIPNTDGYRNDVLAALEELEVPLLRWPGGCFADRYHWRDGIGERKAGLNASWGGIVEPNTFGTHEFFDLAEKLGARTYLNLNMGTGTVQEALDWLEYITSSSDSALAEERRTNGREEPWTVDYYAIGNETWGCGGHMRPDYYADLFVQYSTFIGISGQSPKVVVSGSHEGNIEYSREILEHKKVAEFGDGFSVHYYTLPTGDWGRKGNSTGFPEEEWYSTVQRTLMMDDIIGEQLAMLDEMSPAKELMLYVDEWGMWTEVEDGAAPSALYQQNTIRDAVVAGLNLNIFHAHADRVPMTNIAQMVNVLQAMILTDGPHMVKTPTYHVFHLYRPFQGATAYPVDYAAPLFGKGEESTETMNVSAARGEDGKLWLAIVNADADEAITVQPSAPGVRFTHATGRLLTAEAMDAHNTFDSPEAVTPIEYSVETEGTLALKVPAKSVLVVTLE